MNNKNRSGLKYGVFSPNSATHRVRGTDFKYEKSRKRVE